MKRLIVLYMLLLSCCVLAQNDTIKLHPKQQIEYRHNISAQVNPAGKYLNMIISNHTFKNNIVDWHGAFRYTYTVHPNILVGGEVSYTSLEFYNADSQKDKTKLEMGYYAHDLGALARFICNKPKWCRPFADIVLGYRKAYYFGGKAGTQDHEMLIINQFQWYAAAGVSFRFWKNHFNIDLMCKASTLGFADGRTVTFGWKIGYNFNSK